MLWQANCSAWPGPARTRGPFARREQTESEDWITRLLYNSASRRATGPMRPTTCSGPLAGILAMERRSSLVGEEDNDATL